MIAQQRGEVCALQFAQYAQFPELVHGIFTRQGGYSQAPYDSMNVSLSPDGELFENAVRNRLLALQHLDIAHFPCATMWMVHSSQVLTLDGPDWPDWRTDWSHGSYALTELGYPAGTVLQWTFKPRTKADAIITRQRGVALALSVADCVPLLLYDPVTQAIGIAHAGWRGTARGIAAITVAAMQEQFNCQPTDILAGIGPSIGPCCYEVNEDVRRLFLGLDAFDDLPNQRHYQQLVSETAHFEIKHLPTKESLRLNLWETNRNQLLRAGLLPTHIELSEICTSCAHERFFSHRAEHGRTGRFPVLLALQPN